MRASRRGRELLADRRHVQQQRGPIEGHVIDLIDALIDGLITARFPCGPSAIGRQAVADGVVRYDERAVGIR